MKGEGELKLKNEVIFKGTFECAK
jgi:hypothetical protein